MHLRLAFPVVLIAALVACASSADDKYVGDFDDDDFAGDGVDETDGGGAADGGDGTSAGDGTDGADGTDAADGTDGAEGTDGTDGADGADGADGTSGVDGSAVFSAYCAACHGADGEGGAAPDLTVMVPILSDGELESIITNGSGYMAPIALDDDEVAAVISYLRATFD